MSRMLIKYAIKVVMKQAKKLVDRKSNDLDSRVFPHIEKVVKILDKVL